MIMIIFYRIEAQILTNVISVVKSTLIKSELYLWLAKLLW